MLTSSSLQSLLDRLDGDATKYEELRSKIAHMLRWRGCSESDVDTLADKTLDRVASKLASGEVVEKLNAFAAGVARFIWFEHSRKNKLDAVGDDLPDVPIEPDISVLEDPGPRMRCLRRCVAKKFSDDDRVLILSYYDTDAGEKAKQARKRLADHFGLTMNALKVRACRIRERLEACINDCVTRVTNAGPGDTQIQEVLQR